MEPPTPTMSHDILLVGLRRYCQTLGEALLLHDDEPIQSTVDDWTMQALQDKASPSYINIHMVESLVDDKSVLSRIRCEQIVFLVPILDGRAIRHLADRNDLRLELETLHRNDIVRQRVTIVTVLDPDNSTLHPHENVDRSYQRLLSHVPILSWSLSYQRPPTEIASMVWERAKCASREKGDASPLIFRTGRW